MILQIIHRTSYYYETLVQGSFNDVRLRPINDKWQRRHDFDLRIEPRAYASSYKDFYGNSVYGFEIDEPHQSLVIEAHSIVETSTEMRGEPPSGLDLDALKQADLYEFVQEFIFGSKYVDINRSVWNIVDDILPNGVKDIWADVVTLRKWMVEHFEYDTSATEVHTKSGECLALKRGVCQDYAHVMIGLCRKLGIPARYVSGYLYKRDSDNAARASHAWVEVFLPNYGWKGVDPTHDCDADEHYVRLAVGRDYADIRPVSGTYLGAPSRKLEVFLRINELDKSTLLERTKSAEV